MSVAKGLVPPDGTAADDRAQRNASAPQRVACVGGPAHAQEMVHAGAALVAASSDEELARALAQVFTRAGVVCEQSNDPIGVELAGAAKNAAALAAGATEAQGLNAAGAAAGHIFAEVWRYAEGLGARPESMIGLAGAGDLVATALARESRNRRAGELLAAGVPAAEIPARVGQAVEALESVPLLARALERAGVGAPVTGALGRLISGELPLDDWVALVRATVPPPARWRRRPQPGFWRRVWRRLSRLTHGAGAADTLPPCDPRPAERLPRPRARSQRVRYPSLATPDRPSRGIFVRSVRVISSRRDTTHTLFAGLRSDTQRDDDVSSQQRMGWGGECPFSVSGSDSIYVVYTMEHNIRNRRIAACSSRLPARLRACPHPSALEQQGARITDDPTTPTTPTSRGESYAST